MKCKICNKELSSIRGLSLHLHYKHEKIKLLDYYQKYENFKIPKCEICKIKKCISKNGISYSKTCGNEKCYSLYQSRFSHSDDTKERLSKKRKKWLKENPNKHPWKKADKFISEPCNHLKQKLKSNGFVFSDEFQPSKDKNFSIDIAFQDIRVAIEVNGNQHYNKNKRLKKYYYDRHKYIESLGWKILELHYLDVYRDDVIFIIKKFIAGNKSSIVYDNIPNKNYKKIKKQLIKSLKNKIKKKRIQDKKTALLNSNIDFKKFGWVNKAAQILEIRSQKVNIFMKKHLFDFYEKECFKKQIGVSHSGNCGRL